MPVSRAFSTSTSRGDRNKALYGLTAIARKFPEDRAYIAAKGYKLTSHIHSQSILDNVKKPAGELLKLMSDTEKQE